MSESSVAGPVWKTALRRRTGALLTSVCAGAAAAALLVTGAGVQEVRTAPAPERLELSVLEATEMSRVATFNILGWSHTVPGGDRPGYASGEQRAAWVMKILGKKDLDVVGFQELQTQQFKVMRNIAGDTWEFYPGDQSTAFAMHNSLGWRTDKWQAVEKYLLPIPYFRGKMVPMPYVLLRHVETGRLVWFANFHNPADTKYRPSQEKWRDQAMALQIALANRLWESGLPLIITGDMNEKAEYFCGMTTLAPMRSASGGSWGDDACAPPPDLRIDWIFGSNFVEFSGYRVARAKLIRKTSDHPLIYADVNFPTRPRY